MTKGYGNVSLAIVIPTLNEQEAIGKVLDSIEKSVTSSYVMVVVDGRSEDRTVEIASSRKAEVLFQEGVGYGDALRTGFKHAVDKHDPHTIAMMDGDGTYDAQDLRKLVKPILEGDADLAIGNRFLMMDPEAMSLTNKVGNRVISRLVSFLLGKDIHDTQCGLRAFRSPLAKEFMSCSDGMPFATEMLVTAARRGARIVELPVRYHLRLGTTKLSPLGDGARILLSISASLFMHRRRPRSPLG